MPKGLDMCTLSDPASRLPGLSPQVNTKAVQKRSPVAMRNPCKVDPKMFKQGLSLEG